MTALLAVQRQTGVLLALAALTLAAAVVAFGAWRLLRAGEPPAEEEPDATDSGRTLRT